MHPDLERQRFLDHIEALRERIDLYETSPKEDRRRFGEMRARVERLEAQNAVLQARLAGPAKSWIRPSAGQGCRQPQSGIGTLTFAQVVSMHARQMDREAIAAAAGVDPSTVSRWRVANDYVAMYAPRVVGGSPSPLVAADPAGSMAGVLEDAAAGGAAIGGGQE